LQDALKNPVPYNLRVRKIQFGLKGAWNYFWYRARVNLLTALQDCG